MYEEAYAVHVSCWCSNLLLIINGCVGTSVVWVPLYLPHLLLGGLYVVVLVPLYLPRSATRRIIICG